MRQRRLRRLPRHQQGGSACSAHQRTGRARADASPDRPRTTCPCPTPPLQVWSLMNLAYASHEIISDYTTAAFMWFEQG